MARQQRASSTPASANDWEMPSASHYNYDSDSTNGALQDPVTMPSIAEAFEASELPDLLAALFEALARIDSNRPLPGDGINQNLHTHEILRTHDIEAVGHLEASRGDAQSHDAYLCEARLRHFGARRQRAHKMQSSYFFRVGSAAGG